jgi:hypothetical protein
LCSDGLTSYALGEDILRLAENGTPAEIAARLVQFAKDGGGADNISVIVIFIGQDEGEKTLTWRGQKPVPVNWDDMPTDKHKPVKLPGAAGKSSKKARPGWSYWLVGFIFILIIAGLVVAGMLSGILKIPVTGQSSKPTVPAAVAANEICLYQVQKGETLGIIQVRFGSSPETSLYKTWTCDPGPAACRDAQALTDATQVEKDMWLEIPGQVDCATGGGVTYSQ